MKTKPKPDPSHLDKPIRCRCGETSSYATALSDGWHVKGRGQGTCPECREIQREALGI